MTKTLIIISTLIAGQKRILSLVMIIILKNIIFGEV